MTEFSASGSIDVTVSSSSLSSARETIENELGDVEVDVSSSTSGGGSGSRMAGRERAMGRQLDTERNTQLNEIGSNWSENLELNRERNNLLRELIDVTEMEAQTSRGGGGGIGGGMAMGAMGLAAGGIGLGSMLLDSITESLPEIDPGDILEVPDIGPSDVIDSAASIAPTDIIAEAATVSPANAIEDLANISPADVIEAPLTLTPTDVVETSAHVSATDVIETAAELSPANVVDTAAELSPSDVVDSVVELSPGNIVDSAVDLAPADIVSGTISAQDILSQVTDGLPDISGQEGLDPLAIGGGAVAGAAAGASGLAGRGADALRQGGSMARGALRGGGTAAATRGAGAATPVFTPSMFREDMEGLEGTIFDEDHFLRQAASDHAGDAPEPTHRESTTDPTGGIDADDFIETGDTNVNQDNTVEINPDLTRLQRDVEEGMRDFRDRISSIEDAF